jgi:DUF2075 family protein
MDRSIRGFKNLVKQDKIGGELFLDKIIKNTYKTLMTRGMKGCFVYCTDVETSEYFKSRITSLYSGHDRISLAAEEGSYGQPSS